jgi:Ca-activated chloride channel family protein
MNVENSHVAWLLLCIPVYMYGALISHNAARQWLYQFARIKKPIIPAIVSTIFFSLALAAAIFALAEPKVLYNKTVFNRSGIDIAIGIDVSKSMLAEDETIAEEGKKLFTIPNRLNRARFCALNIISALRGERVGVFMFASKGVMVIPLTADYGYCRYMLKHLNDTAITIPGSNLAEAILTGMSLFDESSRKTVKTIIIISDGEDTSDDKAPIYETAQRAATQGIFIYTVGTGMGRSVLIPIRDATGETIVDYYQDEDGSYLKTRLEPDTLKNIAAITGGNYFRVQDERCEDKIVDAIVSRARTIEYTKIIEPAWFYLSPLLLCAALLFFAIGLITGR